MSPPGERVTDLFIPVRRRQSDTSTIPTESSLDTPAATLTVQYDSTPPTTVSSRRSVRSVPPNPINTASPRGIRYTISAGMTDTKLERIELKTNKSMRNERPKPMHTRRHSEKPISSALPIHELTMRLSRATGVGTSTATNLTAAPSSDKSRLKVTAPTPVMSPDASPIQLHIAKAANVHDSLTPGSHAESQQMISNSKIEVFPTNLPPPIRPSHSRSSSRSDRSFPPSAFPVDFQEKSANQRSPRVTPSRSSSTRHVLSIRSDRSTSPLKFEVSPEKVSTGSPAHKLSRSNTQKSNTTNTSSQRAGTSLSRSTSLSSRREGYNTEIHHYTSCPHTSPPTTRPLNVQPVRDETRGLTYSMIPGSCFDCDTFDRREEESLILTSYNPRIAAHMSDLELVVSSLEKMSPVSPLSPSTQLQSMTLDQTLAQPYSQVSFPEERDSRRASDSSCVSDDIESVPLLYRIEALENRIVELTHDRDREVKELWKGYSQRWGPGVLGVIRTTDTHGRNSERATSGVNSRTSMDSERSHMSQYAPGDGRMRIDWIREQWQ